MSLPIKKTIICKCGNQFDIDVFLSVNTAKDPQLKKKILEGEINSGICPKCGKKYQIFTPFLYHDMDRDFMVEINPQKIGVDKLKKLIDELEKEYTIENAKRRRGESEKETIKINKKIEKVIGIKSSEWLDLPYKKFIKKYKILLKKEEKNIDKRIINATTEKSKQELLNLKNKIEDIRNLHKDIFK